MLLMNTFKKIEVATEWSDGGQYGPNCRSCYKHNVLICSTEKGRMCIDCVISELKNMTEKTNLAGLTFPQISHILNSAGNIRLRLMLLWRFKEVFEVISKDSPADVDELINSLVHNLEYVVQHPLVHAVRQSTCSCSPSGSH
ncbi:hypothetical protein HY792_00870 [Candidatus Desantisbacteria bacterium]|nr:hypothetical protein [Candidatus Desantisbacteria bacterium]